MTDIHVSAAVITDSEGRALLVRKIGTERFMQPGGKPEAGETAAETLVRELREELGLVVFQDQLRPLGTFVSDAANEPGHRVVATAFAMSAEPEDVVAQAELAELRWITEAEQDSLLLAPLSEEHLLPIAWG
ncbi:NUDIX domain-containing protein [Microbacterium sp. NPDC057650]|uniref:NUDIX hydrolase n=1 Tax=unclassified Microbacterium TaxID=2609290 RepID=UPI00366BE70D